MSSLPGFAAREHLLVGFPDLGPTELTASLPVGEAALVVMRPSVARFLVLEPAVRQGEDPDAVHDMRVAARRIRTALRMFRGYLHDTARHLDDELRWIASLMGDVRDNDVRRRWLESNAEGIVGEERAVVQIVDAIFAARRSEAQTAVVTALDSVRFHELRNELVAFTRAPGLDTDEARRSIEEVAPILVGKRHRRMRKVGRALGSDSAFVELHRLRIRAKHARYAIEFMKPLYGDAAESVVRRIRRLQDVLGELHDDELMARQLRELAEGSNELPEGSTFVLGELSERASRRARKLRRRFQESFRRTRGGKWKGLKKAMGAG